MEGSKEELIISSKFSPLGIFGHKIQQVILPIIAVAEGEIIPLGTGFIISPDGLMITAKHVIDEVAESRLIRHGHHYKNPMIYALYITNKENEEYKRTFIGGNWPIDRAWYNPGLDIAYCWIRQAVINNIPFKFKNYVKLSPGLPKVEEHILGFGYYKIKGFFTGKVINSNPHVKYSQNTAFTTGVIKELFYPKRDSSQLNFPCFHTDARFDPGMSGGPIFNETGGVCGVICDSFGEIGEDDNKEYVSYGSLIWPSLITKLNIRVENDPSVKEGITVYNAIKKGFIIVDKTFDQIEYSEEGEKVSIELKKHTK